MARQAVIIAYDITSGRRRRQARRVLAEWRLDGQQSVHECWLTRAEAQELVVQLGAILAPAEDRLLVAWLAGDRPAEARGQGTVTHLTAKLHHSR